MSTDSNSVYGKSTGVQGEDIRGIGVHAGVRAEGTFAGVLATGNNYGVYGKVPNGYGTYGIATTNGVWFKSVINDSF